MKIDASNEVTSLELVPYSGENRKGQMTFSPSTIRKQLKEVGFKGVALTAEVNRTLKAQQSKIAALIAYEVAEGASVKSVKVSTPKDGLRETTVVYKEKLVTEAEREMARKDARIAELEAREARRLTESAEDATVLELVNA